MTGVVEIAAVGALVAGGLKEVHQRREKEEAAGLQLYTEYFHANLLEQSSGEVTMLGKSLPSDLCTQAAKSIQIIEDYQKGRKHWFSVFSSSDSGDVRSRVLEELKQWLMTLSSGKVETESVSHRLRYCTQFLLRPSVFPESNSQSFVNTLAQVSSQLSSLLRLAMANQDTGIQQLGEILALGSKLAEALVPVLFFVLPSEAAVPFRSQTVASWAGKGTAPQKGPGLAAIRQAADLSGGVGSLNLVDSSTDAGRVLLSLFRTEHFLEAMMAKGASAVSSGTLPDNAAVQPLAAVLGETRSKWAKRTNGASTGMSEGLSDSMAPVAFLDLCLHIDRVFFFLAALRPYHNLAGVAGDMGMCWLRESLGHLLQELEKALLELHKARLTLLHAANLRLQALSKSQPKAMTEPYRWMQGLRYIEETELVKLHRGIVKLCAELRLATTVAQEVELTASTKRQLESVVGAFSSAEFQSRCTPALRDLIRSDMRELSQLTDGAQEC